MVAIRAAAGVLAWCAYSAVQRMHINKGSFAAMQLLAATRSPDGVGGDCTQMLPLIETLRPEKSIPDNWVHLAGNAEVASNDEDDCLTVRANDVICRLSKDQSSYGLFGPSGTQTLTMRQLVAKHTIKPKIYEDTSTRLNWMRNINACVLAADSKCGTSKIDGAYSFCFRDYVNHEELLAMMCRRLAVENLFVRPTRTGILSVSEIGSKCLLSESGVAFGFLPIRIDWEGHIEEGEVIWDSTLLRLGWKRLGKTFDKPAAAEKLRVDPWVVYLPKEEEETGDIIVFYRKNSGKLVYARDECLNQK